MEINSKPEELDEMERKILQLEIEKAALLREKDSIKLESIEKDLAEFREQKNAFTAQWQKEKDVLDLIQQCKENLDSYKLEAEQAERASDFGMVAEIRYGKVKET